MAKSTSKSTGKRELIEPNGDKRYVRRNEKGEFTESDDQGKSLSQDIKKAAKTKVKAGHGDERPAEEERCEKSCREKEIGSLVNTDIFTQEL